MPANDSTAKLANCDGGLRFAYPPYSLEATLPFYAALCGRTLARAHARSGDPALIAGYTGNGTAFDEAIAEFAVLYADQTEKDWESFKAAIAAGRLQAADPETKPSV